MNQNQLKQAVLCSAIISFAITLLGRVPFSRAQSSTLGSQIASDARYISNNVVQDGQDIATAPFDPDKVRDLLSSPRFYLVLAGAGALFGGSFALDQTMYSHLRSMGRSTADAMEYTSYGTIGGATGLLYLYGLANDDSSARHYALTALEGAAVSTLVDLGIKSAFGRKRPRQGHGHTAFFDGGDSFVSGQVTPVFALAAGLSDYFDNEWYAALPIYSLALLDGFGRMGNNAHWFSDVIGAALLGTLTTQLFVYLHHEHAEQSGRFELFPETAPAPINSRGQVMAPVPTGVGIGIQW
jgi:membrane-associated phospholipid phosphatase